MLQKCGDNQDSHNGADRKKGIVREDGVGPSQLTFFGFQAVLKVCDLAI
ncbi:MAG: hypothetical protein MUD03_18050 [Pirellula sp.]|nr:hypothetical protein [Pirellula sp.]